MRLLQSIGARTIEQRNICYYCTQMTDYSPRLHSTVTLKMYYAWKNIIRNVQTIRVICFFLFFYVNKYMEVRHSFSMICFGGIYFQGHCSTNKMVYFQIYIIIVWIKILYFHQKKMPIISPTMYMKLFFISTSNFHYFLKHEFLLNFGTYTFFPVMEKE